MRYKAHITAFFIVTLFLAIGGCGNGEGVGKPLAPSGNLPSDSIYYDLNPTHVCPSSTVYRNSIQFTSTGIELKDNCTNGTQLIELGDLEISSAFYLVGYQGAIYELRTSVPTAGDVSEIYTQVFCRSVSGVEDIEFRVRTGPGLTNPSGSFVSLTASATADVAVSTSGSLKTYEATGAFELSIDLGSTSFAPYEYSATLNIQGESTGRPMACRVGN